MAIMTDICLYCLLEASTLSSLSYTFSLSLCPSHCKHSGFLETRQLSGWIFVPCWKRSNKTDITTLRPHYSSVSTHRHTHRALLCLCVCVMLSHQRALSAHIHGYEFLLLVGFHSCGSGAKFACSSIFWGNKLLFILFVSLLVGESCVFIPSWFSERNLKVL